MGKRRLDTNGRVLHKGEGQRKDKGIYYYSYTDLRGKRQVIYASSLAELRKKEEMILKDTLDGIHYGEAKSTSVNDLFDRYIESKKGLKEHIRTSYRDYYERYLADEIGKKMVSDVRYSDIKACYMRLIQERNLKIRTIEGIQVPIKAAFNMAVKDNLIRNNPTAGVLAELRKEYGNDSDERHPLTIEQQRAFLNYTGTNPEFMEWYPLMVVMFGTGVRVGELIGLRWEDIDYEYSLIHIRRTIVYRKMESGHCELHANTTKTTAGTRDIPMMRDVAAAFRSEYEMQKEFGFTETVVDGLDGFIFGNKDRALLKPASINNAIKKITTAYNWDEKEAAEKANRLPLLIPHFSCHHIRHTFCTRLCEAGSNIKVIQDVMGHVDIKTTMNVYAEATARSKKQEFIRMEEMSKVF